ncbi:MAG TPA: sulfate adenylyltransferase subunit CysD [Planctomycetota bacterium]|nr:sulfate adenylyltransferase subunit CysD [Planctomycetota bacterium]
MKRYSLNHLQQLEQESMHIIREVAAEFERPVLLYSIGKDSGVMLRLAQKAFAPAPIPFPVLHVNTGWKFREMIEFRDRIVRENGLDLVEWRNQEGARQGINPFDHGTQRYTHVMKTEALVQAMTAGRYDAAFGGARRDEERSRAKERVFSFRDRFHQWDPKNQRPELWSLFNCEVGKGESMRVFPLSNWTELDVWIYVHQERLPMVPLYFAKQRPVVRRLGKWIMVDDERMRLEPGERPELRSVRFRTLGCYPLTAAIESQADTVPKIVEELLASSESERSGRVIDNDGGTMEQKKREGYF